MSLTAGDQLGLSGLQRAYQERFADLLNYATLPFYWGSYEHEKGRPEALRLQRLARWCAADRRSGTPAQPASDGFRSGWVTQSASGLRNQAEA